MKLTLRIVLAFQALGAMVALMWSTEALAADSATPAPATPAASPFAPTFPNKAPAPGPAPDGMVWIPGGEFSMGCMAPSEGHYTMATMNAVHDAEPIHRVYVYGFWMDTNDVTNAKFDQFVKATGYVTVAGASRPRRNCPPWDRSAFAV